MSDYKYLSVTLLNKKKKTYNLFDLLIYDLKMISSKNNDILFTLRDRC